MVDWMNGQIAIEFIFYISIFIFLLTVIFTYSSSMTLDAVIMDRKFEAENICRYFSVLMSTITTSGNGTIVEYSLPPNIGGEDYKVIVNNSTRFITIDYIKGAQSCQVNAGNFTSLIITKKNGRMLNTGTTILIEQG
jgi:hypothetical protein